MQDSVKLRDMKSKKTKTTGNPPLEYPFISQQIDEKKKMRNMYNSLLMNTYLDDSDTSFDSYESVDSHQVKHYEDKYRALMKQTNVPASKKIYFKLHKKHLPKQ